MLVRYFIPEDGDDETQPNVFLAPKPRQPGYPPTLADIKHAFPLPGRYHFRFKSPIVPGTDREKGSLAVWMDCTDDRQPVQTWRNQIICKVTRIGVEDDLDDDDDDDFQRPTVAATHNSTAHQPPPPPPKQQAKPAPVPAAPSFDLFDGPATTAHIPKAPMSNGHSSTSTGNLLDGHHHHHHPPPQAAPNSGSLLDMNYQQQPKQAAHADFLGMTATPSPPVSGNYQTPGNSNNFSQPQQNFSQQQQRGPQPQQKQNTGTFDSFGSHSQGAFGDLGTPWKT